MIFRLVLSCIQILHRIIKTWGKANVLLILLSVAAHHMKSIISDYGNVFAHPIKVFYTFPMFFLAIKKNSCKLYQKSILRQTNTRPAQCFFLLSILQKYVVSFLRDLRITFISSVIIQALLGIKLFVCLIPIPNWRKKWNLSDFIIYTFSTAGHRINGRKMKKKENFFLYFDNKFLPVSFSSENINQFNIFFSCGSVMYTMIEIEWEYSFGYREIDGMELQVELDVLHDYVWMCVYIYIHTARWIDWTRSLVILFGIPFSSSIMIIFVSFTGGKMGTKCYWVKWTM